MHEPLGDPHKELDDKSSKEVAEQMFFMMVSWDEKNYTLKFKNGAEMIVTRKELIEIISQASIGLLLGG